MQGPVLGKYMLINGILELVWAEINTRKPVQLEQYDSRTQESCLWELRLCITD